MSKREVRFQPAMTEIRVATNDKGEKTIAGLAIPFNALSEDLGGFREKFAPGALDRCLQTDPDLLLITEHNVSRGVLARTSSGTLQVHQDANGLNFDASLPPTTLGNDTAISLERGDLRSMSFAFACNKDQWDKQADDTYIRTVLDADIYELSVVSTPAYPQSTAALRSLQFPDGAPTLPVEPPSEARDANDNGCECPCPECVAGDCADCSNDLCEDPECRCQDQRAAKLLAEVIERRLRH